jgi:hypothetical protein
LKRCNVAHIYYLFGYLLIIGALAKNGSFGFARVGLCVGQNQMCHLCGWLKLFLKNVRWEKIKIQKRWLLGRLSVGSFVPSLYVYFCRSFLLCRLLGLQVTVPGFVLGGLDSRGFDRNS